MVRSALALLGKPVIVSPVVLQEERGAHLQWELAGAAWTVASVKNLLEAGASSITYFDALGPRGVVGTDAETVPSTHRQVSPIYHVLADLGDWRTTVLVPSTSSNPLAVETLAVRSERGAHVLVANLTPEMQRCDVPSESVRTTLRTLEKTALTHALREPDAFRAERTLLRPVNAVLHVELPPYSVVRLDPG
jgi:hypothetical protein